MSKDHITLVLNILMSCQGVNAALRTVRVPLGDNVAMAVVGPQYPTGPRKQVIIEQRKMERTELQKSKTLRFN